jgi:UPF0755 protein
LSNKFIKFIISIIIFAIIATGSFFYFRYRVYNSHGSHKEVKIFHIEKGEGSSIVSKNLAKSNLVSGNWYFCYYMKSSGLLNKILPGDYELSGKMTIPEIAIKITQEQNKSIKMTFPEGWDSNKIAERISANGFSGNEFLNIVNTPSYDLTSKYSFFSLLPRGVSLEGYLFPDTYFFSQKLTSEDIVKKFLNNFDNRLSQDLREAIKKQGKSLEDIITMASIIEREVKNEEDRKVVSGIFWNRIKIGQPLQSCATIAFILGTNKKQYSFEDTRIQSPYNTYINSGLPPGPISNPGLSSIEAAIFPGETNYNYFLSDPETGKTIFSRTIEEHNSNKDKFGL